jgi:hypothetical protein
MTADDCVKCRTVYARGQRQAKLQQASPFIPLHAEKNQAEQCGEAQPIHEPLRVSSANGPQRTIHGVTAPQQDARIHRGHDDRQARLEGRWPYRAAGAEHQESAEETGKKHPFGANEEHHPQACVVDRRFRLVITTIAIVAEGGLGRRWRGWLRTLNKLRHLRNERIRIRIDGCCLWHVPPSTSQDQSELI